MDLIWDCMNIASRISKQIEASDNLVPKHQQQTSGVTPSADLQELVTTVNSVRTILVPFVTSSKKSKGVSELPAFELCLKTLKQTLNDLFDYFKDLEKEFSIYTWKTQKVKLYQIDFLLKQKLDQFASLFNIEESKDPKAKSPKLPTGASFIVDPEGKEWWCKAFGENTIMVPWNSFFPALEAGVGVPLKEDEESFRAYLDPTKIDHVSAFSFSVFLKWFGPFKLACPRMIEAIHGGLLCGFVPAVEANLLLENKREGTFLIRCSKTQPGSFAVTFVDNALKVKHCLLYAVHPSGLTLKNPPTVYQSLKEFSDAHTSKLKRPLGNRWTSSKNMPEFDFGRAGNRAQPEPTSTTTEVKDQPPAKEGTGPVIAADTCVVCMDAPFETVFLECGHLACCHKCSVQLKLCPICRNPISRIVPIFRAT